MRGVKATGGILGLVLVTGCPVIDCQVSCQAGGHWSELSGQSTWSPLRLSVGSSRRILPGAETHNRGSSIPRSPCPPFLISFPESLFTRSSTTQRLATVLFSGAQIKAAVLSRVNIFDQQTQSPKDFMLILLDRGSGTVVAFGDGLPLLKTSVLGACVPCTLWCHTLVPPVTVAQW